MAATYDPTEEDLQVLKSEIRSLLVSNRAKSVLLNQFLKEYELLVGKPLPYKEFNYKTPLRFLSKMTDVVQVIDAHDGIRLTPVVSELSGHISKMVDQQKRTSRRHTRIMTYYPPRFRETQPPQKTLPSLLDNWRESGPKLESSQKASQTASKPAVTSQKPSPRTELIPEPEVVTSKTATSPRSLSKEEGPSLSPCKTQESSTPPAITKPFSPSSRTEPSFSTTPETSSMRTSKPESFPQPPSKTESSSVPPPKTEPTSVQTVKTGPSLKSEPSWHPNTNAISFHPGVHNHVPQHPYHPSMIAAYPRAPPFYTFSAPLPLMPPFPRENWRQPNCYPQFSYGPPTHYNFGFPQYPNFPPSSVPYGQLRKSFATQSEINVPNFDDNINEVPEDDGYDETENASRRNSPMNDDVTCPENYEAVETIGPFPTSVGDLPDVAAECVDGASLDVQSSGQEIQNYSSPGSFSDTSKSSEIQSGEIKSKIWALLEKHTNGVSTSSFLDLYEKLHSYSLDIASLGYSSVKEMVLKNEDIFSFEKNKSSDAWILYDARVKPRRRQSQVLSNKWIPHYVVDNLATLARKHPEGIDADEILLLYKDEYSTEINPEILGFENLHSFLTNCKSVAFRMYGDKGMVYPKDWVSKSSDPSRMDELKEPALPPTEELKYLWKDYFMEHECDPSFKYKPPLIPEDKLLLVKVVDVHSPALMWIQFLDDVKSLNNLMYQMNSHYDMEQKDYTIPESFVMPGLAVASMFAGKWHRAVIISVRSEIAELLYIDYGTICRVNVSDLRKLDKRFGQDRVYSVKASLFCLVPFEGDEWSVESCDFLYSNYAEKMIYAEICAVNYQGPFVEVIFFDTSGEKEINVNDLLVSKKLARYMTNPASVLNERSISTFYKFLPRWFSMSNQRDSDPNACYENLTLCTSGGSNPIRLEVVPCCKLHCIQQLFQANYEELAGIWENAIRQEEERIVNNILRRVEDSLTEWGWESCLTSELCCLDKASRDAPIVDKASRDDPVVDKASRNPPVVDKPTRNAPVIDKALRDAPVVDRSPQIVDNFNGRSEQSSNSRISEPASQLSARLKRQHDNKVERTPEENNNPPLSRSSSRTSHRHCWTPGNRNVVSNWNDLRRPSKPVLLHPRAIVKYFDAQLSGTSLTLIYFSGDVWVCLSQLFKLTKLPSMLAKKRLEISDVEPNCIVASRRTYPDLYNDLYDLDLLTPEGDPVMVLLGDAPRIIRAVDPLGNYQEVFENLAKEVAPFLDELFQ